MDKWLYLDDLRTPPDDGRNWIVARSVAEAIKAIKHHSFVGFSLDHDLGEGVPTGHDFVKQLAGEVIPDKVVIHTANPVGRENMIGYLSNYCEFMGINCEIVIEYNCDEY